MCDCCNFAYKIDQEHNMQKNINLFLDENSSLFFFYYNHIFFFIIFFYIEWLVDFNNGSFQVGLYIL